jgi:lactate dehydrogenase-like 2-hydroxyacid dehydrogenase
LTWILLPVAVPHWRNIAGRYRQLPTYWRLHENGICHFRLSSGITRIAVFATILAYRVNAYPWLLEALELPRTMRPINDNGGEIPMSKIGFIGLGIMGRPMAGHLQAAGHQLYLHQHRSPLPEALLEAGAETCATLREVAGKADTIITMLPDTPQVAQVLFGENGVA